MKEVLLFEVIDVKSHLGCYLSDVKAIFEVSGERLRSELSSFQLQNSLLNTVKADGKQLPIEKLSCPVMFCHVFQQR